MNKLIQIILFFLYVIVVTPLAILYRALWEDPLNRKFEKNKKSYWIPK